jgi:hypothetical protein
MRIRTPFVIGLALCVVAALLMLTDVISTAAGIVLGTLGVLTIGTAARPRTSRTRENETR